MEYLILYAILCLIVGWMASSTTLGFGSAFLLSIIFTPVIGFIVMLFYPNKKHREEQATLLKKIASSRIGETNSLQLMHDKLEKLESMKEKNLITEKEYQFMREEIMQKK